MSYFRQIDDCQTYSNQKYDFHYDYNGNSGGGQPFLGGQFALNDGDEPHKPLYLNGKIATFVVRFVDSDGAVHNVDLGTKDEYRLPITPRSTGSKQMKLKTEGKLVRPSLLLPAVLMLPETTTVDMAATLDTSPLTTGNYWLQSMWLNCELTDDVVHLVPKDYVFCGGTSKRGEYADQDGKPTGNAMFFELDYGRRINDILYAADNCKALSQPAAAILQYFRDVLLGIIAFDHRDCYLKTAELMSLTAREHPTIYAGIDDPLPTIMEVVGKPIYSNESSSSVPPKVNEPRNLIFFGAPGTGKSYQLARLAEKCFDKKDVRRVTFHPDYTYAQFVGCYKPITTEQTMLDEDGKETVVNEVTYDFVPGPFLETYVAAVQNTDVNYLLIIEEINRANPAAAFGDIFQLLDRDDDGRSEYEIAVPREMRRFFEIRIPEYNSNARADSPQQYLSEEFRLDGETKRLSLPPNMYIWATMNSADQGVFPMDTAFKRRWDFRYLGINDGSAKLDGIAVPLGKPARMVRWDALRRGINKVLLDAGVNEDKLLGPFFISPSRLRDTAHFTQTFMDKVLLYLFEDAAKTKKSKVFSKEGNPTYSDICEDFRARGELAFRGMKELAAVDDGKDDETEEPDGIDGEA